MTVEFESLLMLFLGLKPCVNVIFGGHVSFSRVLLVVRLSFIDFIISLLVHLLSIFMASAGRLI